MRITWKQLQEKLRSESKLNGPREAIFQDSKLIGISEYEAGYLAKIAVRSKLSASMLDRLLMPDIRAAFDSLLGAPTAIEIEVNSSQECFPLESLVPEVLADIENESGAPAATFRFRERLALDPLLNFESFVETRENRFGLNAMRELSCFSSSDFSVVALHGPAGVGKSHLLHAAGNHAKSLHPNALVKVVTGDEFITDFQNAIAKRNMGDFRRRYRMETNFLLVDDLHSMCRAKATQEEFFNLMNHMASTGRRIAITCDRPIPSLDGLEDRIKSRLSGGLAIHMDRPSVEGRLAILASKLKRRGIFLPDHALQVIAKATEGCVRGLEGMVNRLALMSRSGCLDDQAIEHLISQAPATPIKLTSGEIMKQVATQHNLTLDELKGKGRAKPQVNARRESMRRLKQELGLSLSEIGRLHLRDHSTVLNALRT